jgi:hypothetical protein
MIWSDLGFRKTRIFFPMGLDSPDHTKSSPSGVRFLYGVILHRDGKEEFDTSGKSPAPVDHRRKVRVECKPHRAGGIGPLRCSVTHPKLMVELG